MLLDLIFIFNLLTNGGFQHETNLAFVHLDYLPNDLIGEAMMNHLLLVFPYKNPSFLQTNAHEDPSLRDVEALNRVLLRTGIKDWNRIWLKFPPLNSLI
jgi:hypothetical protein